MTFTKQLATFGYRPLAHQLDYPIHLWPTPARLNNSTERERFFEAIFQYGSVRKACRQLGLNRPSVYLMLSRDADFKAQFDEITDCLRDALLDEAVAIADEARESDYDKNDKAFASLVRLQVDARLRVAGKHAQIEVNNTQINDNRRVVVMSEQKTNELRERFKRLQQSND